MGGVGVTGKIFLKFLYLPLFAAFIGKLVTKKDTTFQNFQS